jgi:hypothetical protein
MAEQVRWMYILLQVSILFISLVYGIIYWNQIKQHGYLKLFPLYTGISLSLSLLWFFKIIHFRGLLIQNIFILFEFLIFYNFFIKVLKNKKFYFILITLNVLFFLSIFLVVAFLYNNQNKYMNIISFLRHLRSSELSVIENIFIVIPVLLYYISLFNRPYIKNLSGDPIFLVMTGILFCMVLSIPVFAFQNIIMDNNRQVYLYLYIINSISYIIMHLFFIKAFKSID